MTHAAKLIFAGQRDKIENRVLREIILNKTNQDKKKQFTEFNTFLTELEKDCDSLVGDLKIMFDEEKNEIDPTPTPQEGFKPYEDK